MVTKHDSPDPNNLHAKLRDSTYKKFLEYASFFNEFFSIDWIQEISSLKTTEILLASQKACDEEYLSRLNFGMYHFSDNNIKNKIQKKITGKDKLRAHRNIANILLNEISDELERAKQVYPHLLPLRNDLKDCHHLIDFGNILLNNFQPNQALECYLKAIQELQTFDSLESNRLFVKTTIIFAKISSGRYDTQKTISLIRKAIDISKASKLNDFKTLLEMHLAKNEWMLSQYSKALSNFNTAWSTVETIEDPFVKRAVNNFSTFFLFWQGKFRDVIRDYEKIVDDIEKQPNENFPLLTFLTVGLCYLYVGQTSQGVGMLDSSKLACLEKGDRSYAALASFMLGMGLLDIRKIDGAIDHLKWALNNVSRKPSIARIYGNLYLAYAFFLKNEVDKALTHLKTFLRHRDQLQLIGNIHVPVIDIAWSMKQRKIPSIEGLSFEKEINQATQIENVFMKGVAYRYKALAQKVSGDSFDNIIANLNISQKYLDHSGHQIELSKTKLQLGCELIKKGDKNDADTIINDAAKTLLSYNKSLIPQEYDYIIKNFYHDDGVLKEILNLGQQIITVKNRKDLVQSIISIVNRITGAERGAIFLLDNKKLSLKFSLHAAKNIRAEEITQPEFEHSMKVIKEVFSSGKGQIITAKFKNYDNLIQNKNIRSFICVPMRLRDQVVGVLYHDNRLLNCDFGEKNMEILEYFAAQAAIALENVNAYNEIQRLNRKLNEENKYYQEHHLETIKSDDFIGKSPVILELLSKIKNVALTDATVLILGDTGVGKEVAARTLHKNSNRSEKAFISVHCSALPETLILSELFGHEKGAFTGASQKRTGRFELADKGTIFLDEIGDISIEVQIKLLRILQTKKFERVGSNQTINSDFRLIAATNRNLKQAVENKEFRADLYYRLNVFPLYVPPLKERKEDIPLLSYYFLNQYSKKTGKNIKIKTSDIEKLSNYDWPGNVRELENVIERGTILSFGEEFVMPELDIIEPTEKVDDKMLTMEEMERQHIKKALSLSMGKIRGPNGAATILEMHPNTLYYRMKKHGIKP